jgi:FkbM family methyltransferase
MRAAEAANGRAGRVSRGYRAWYLRRRFAGLVALLPRNALVFDIGANVGLWTDVLRSAGCRIIAVEPQADCAAQLDSRYAGDAGVTVVAAAVAESEGELDLYLGGSTEHATTSRHWMNDMVARAGYEADYWRSALKVRAITLDQLIERFGAPDYLKLDVEGSELSALRGLSRPLPLVSFETHGETVDDARACITRLLELGDFEFNLTPGDFPSPLWPEWRAGEDVIRALEAGQHGWNNVLARRR